jgi:hypothetical protein
VDLKELVILFDGLRYSLYPEVNTTKVGVLIGINAVNKCCEKQYLNRD